MKAENSAVIVWLLCGYCAVIVRNFLGKCKRLKLLRAELRGAGQFLLYLRTSALALILTPYHSH